MPMRLYPSRKLPPYSYVPGKFPHPIRDERGHSFGHLEPPPATPYESLGRGEYHPYLWGFDLFNHGYYWEAHETWEAVWHACGRSGTRADLLKGLIKLSAAGVKAREGSLEGVRRHLLRAAELFETVEQAIRPAGWLMGLRPLALALRARELAAQSDELVNTIDEPVVAVLPVVLEPVLGSESPDQDNPRSPAGDSAKMPRN